MTTFVLVRHAKHTAFGERILGRTSGVHLSAEGLAQAKRLAERLCLRPIDRIFSSPLDRAQETARPIAQRLDLPFEVVEAISEIDYGLWAGRDFDDLRRDELWAAYNSFRSGTRIPGGELMPEAQLRIVGFLDEVRRKWPDGRILAVSHGDVIRAALAYYLGMPLDLFQRLQIDPASVSTVSVDSYGPRVIRINEVFDD